MIRIYHDDERTQKAETGLSIEAALDLHKSNLEVMKKFKVGMNVCMTSTRRSGWPDMIDTMYQYGTVTGFRDHGNSNAGKVLVSIMLTQTRDDGRDTTIHVDATDNSFFTIEVL